MKSNPLFKGLTRPSMKARVSMEILVSEIIVFFVLMVFIGSASIFLLVVPVHIFNMMLFEHDNKSYNLIGSYIKHSVAMANQKVWKARSYRP